MHRITNLLIMGALVYMGWYGYSNWIATSADPTPPGAGAEAGFNCRQALATLAKDYACRESAECELSNADMSEVRQLERSIEQHCN